MFSFSNHEAALWGETGPSNCTFVKIIRYPPKNIYPFVVIIPPTSGWKMLDCLTTTNNHWQSGKIAIDNIAGL